MKNIWSFRSIALCIFFTFGFAALSFGQIEKIADNTRTQVAVEMRSGTRIMGTLIAQSKDSISIEIATHGITTIGMDKVKKVSLIRPIILVRIPDDSS